MGGKITLEQYEKFKKEYFNTPDMKKHLRFGQAFINKFGKYILDGKSDPDTYHCIDPIKVQMQRIENKYVETENIDHEEFMSQMEE